MSAIVFLVGLALLTAGVALIYAPAGFIVAGGALMIGTWLYVRGAG